MIFHCERFKISSRNLYVFYFRNRCGMSRLQKDFVCRIIHYFKIPQRKIIKILLCDLRKFIKILHMKITCHPSPEISFRLFFREIRIDNEMIYNFSFINIYSRAAKFTFKESFIRLNFIFTAALRTYYYRRLCNFHFYE